MSFSKKEIDKIITGGDSAWKKYIQDFNISLLAESFVWTNKSAIIIPAMIKGIKVSVVINTGCSGVIISQSYYDRLKLVSDDEVEIT